jgi:hypothetical protein
MQCDVCGVVVTLIKNGKINQTNRLLEVVIRENEQ